MAQNPPAMQETWVQSLGWDDPLEEGMATLSSILAWRIPMDRGTWRPTVHEVTKSQTQLSNEAQSPFCRMVQFPSNLFARLDLNRLVFKILLYS